MVSNDLELSRDKSINNEEVIYYWKDRGGSRISGKGIHIYKGVGYDLLILSHFSY